MESKYWLIFLSVFGGICLGTIEFYSRISFTTHLLIILLFIGLIFLRYIWFFFILLLASLPFNSLLSIDIGAPLRLSYIIGVYFILSVVYTRNLEKKTSTPFQTPLDFPLLIFLFFILVSVFQSQSIVPNSPVISKTIINYPWIKSITKFLLLIFLILLYYATVYFLNTKEKIRIAIFWFVLFVALYSCYGLISYGTFLLDKPIEVLGFPSIIQHDPSTDLPRIRAMEEEPTFFGFYILSTLFILFSMMYYHITKKLKIYPLSFLLISLLIILSALLLTYSRSAWIGFFMGFLLLLSLIFQKSSFKEYVLHAPEYYKRYKLYLIIVVLSILTFAILTLPLVLQSKIGEQITDIYNPQGHRYWSTRTRLITYNQAWTAFLQHPFFGIGYENFNFYSGNKYYPGLVEFNFNWPEVNNYPLKVLTELGIFGFFAFLYLISVIFYLIYTAIQKSQDTFISTILMGSFATFVAFGTMLLFSSSIIMPYIWIALAIAMASVQLQRGQSDEHSN